LPPGADPARPLGLSLEHASLRAALEAATASLPLGSREERRVLEVAWERLAQLEVLGLVELDDVPDALDPPPHDGALLTVARTLSDRAARAGVVIDLLGRSFDVVAPGVRLLVVPRSTGRTSRAYATTETLEISYLDASLDADTRARLDAAITALGAIEARMPAIDWRSTLEPLAGAAFVLEEDRILLSSPSDVRALGARR
jgi:hypothetical protein